MSDKVEERKEKVKPTKLFTITTFVYDDGVLSGYGTEYRNMGRLKNQKLIFPGKEELVSSIRSMIPSAFPTVEPLIDAIYADVGIEDSEGSEKFGKATIDIYSDGFIDCDFSEIIKGSRGAPKAWRLPARDFVSAIANRLGRLGDTFKPLLNAGNAGVIEASGKAILDDEMDQIDEELEQELE
jgi:hypothetical protein